MKSINTVAGTGNPVKITDLETLWDNISMCLIGRTGNTATIISGCEYDGSEMKEGIIFFKNIAYTLFDPVPDGYYIYAQSVKDENRTYEDGTVHQFYYNNVINSSNSGTETTLGTLIGEINEENISAWTWTRIADSSITTGMLAPNSVTNDILDDYSVSARKIIDYSVQTSKIANMSVTDGKLANGAVTARTIAAGAVGYTQLADGAVSTQKLAEESVGTNNLIDKSVTTDILADSAVTTPKIAANTIIDAKLVGQTILNRSLSTGCVNTRVLADKAVTTAKLEDGSVTSIKMAMGSVGGDIIADKAVTGAKIADKTITSEQLGEDAIVGGIGGVIAPETISMYNMGVNCIGTPQLVDGAVTGLKVAAEAIIDYNIKAGSLTERVINRHRAFVGYNVRAQSSFPNSTLAPCDFVSLNLSANMTIRVDDLDISNQSGLPITLVVTTPSSDSAIILSLTKSSTGTKIFDFGLAIGMTTTIQLVVNPNNSSGFSYWWHTNE